MENATKALLIAAAVLIAIVIIALGIKLISSTKSTVDSADAVGDMLKDGIKDTLYTKILDMEKFKKALNRTGLKDYEIQNEGNGLLIYGTSIRAPEDGKFDGGLKIMNGEFKKNTQYKFVIDFQQNYVNAVGGDGIERPYIGITMYVMYDDYSKSANLLEGANDTRVETNFESEEGKTIKCLQLSYGTGNAKTHIYDFDIYEIDKSSGELKDKSIFDILNN